VKCQASVEIVKSLNEPESGVDETLVEGVGVGVEEGSPEFPFCDNNQLLFTRQSYGHLQRASWNGSAPPFLQSIISNA